MSFHRALLEIFIILCTLAQLPIILCSLFFFTIAAIIFPSYYDLEPFIDMVWLLFCLPSLGFVVTEMIVLLRSNSDRRSRLFVFLQCIKNLIWIVLVLGFGYITLPPRSSDHWSSDTWSCLGWTTLGILPFLASLLFTLSHAMNHGVEMEKTGADEQTPLLEESALENRRAQGFTLVQ